MFYLTALQSFFDKEVYTAKCRAKSGDVCVKLLGQERLSQLREQYEVVGLIINGEASKEQQRWLKEQDQYLFGLVVHEVGVRQAKGVRAAHDAQWSGRN